MARLFFAIWPAAPARDALARLAADVARVTQGRAVEGAKIHLTLAFLGEVAQPRMAEVRAAASGLRARRFDLSLDRLGSFRRSRVAWATASVLPPELTALQVPLEEALTARGFELEARPYRPHITLARRTVERLPAASIAPVAWPCEELALVVSDLATGQYRTLESWALG
ncbi:MAG TPA: RNA 2',3'-cyclic phosphodiesterase [Usitatibacter sp.]|jgi:2'-5' RNA ligase|nr:RNA 2',3'-cyclic phosphodiesterase [Usitatibacter sp.]